MGSGTKSAFNRARLGDATSEILGGISETSAWMVGNSSDAKEIRNSLRSSLS